MGGSNKNDAAANPGAQATVTALMAANPVATIAWLHIMSEGARFMSDRLKQDLETQWAILGCKSPAELLAVQSEFIKTAMEQYTDEVARLVEVISSGTKDTIEDALHGHSRNYDDVPL